VHTTQGLIGVYLQLFRPDATTQENLDAFVTWWVDVAGCPPANASSVALLIGKKCEFLKLTPYNEGELITRADRAAAAAGGR